MDPRERLIVALDVDNEKKALEAVDALDKNVKFFKVGFELFSSCGPGIVERIQKKGCNVFLDLKFHDIPTTVKKAALSVTKLGVFMFNVHALGGFDMMKEAADAVKDEAKRFKREKPKLIAVTVLTSMDENALKKVGIDDTIDAQVLRLAMLAEKAGLDGVVASPEEARAIREKLGKNFLIVTPGVRPAWAASNDQKRIATPHEALQRGADFVVVGRPILEAQNPALAAEKVIEELRL